MYELAESFPLLQMMGASTNFVAEFRDKFHDDGIDLFLLDAYPPADPVNGPFYPTGYAVGGTQGAPQTACVLRGTLETAPQPVAALSRTISHEIGHCLGLWHTHGGQGENVDGSQCLERGDLLCDTPPDPNLAFNVDANCEWVTANLPSNLLYNPDLHNIMSFTNDVCRTKGFTPDQGRRMRNMLATRPVAQAFLVQETITSNTNWTVHNTPGGERVIDGNLVVESGAVLSIGLGVKVRFSPQSSLVIRPGGSVHLTGTLTSSQGCPSCGANDECGPGWIGVVMQSENASISTRPGAVIENAEIGIAAWNYVEIYDVDGDGLFDPSQDLYYNELQPHKVNASFTTFRNNQIAVDFGPSKNLHVPAMGFSPPDGNEQLRSVEASFYGCTFTTTDDYERTTPFIGFARLREVDGPEFSNCSFTNHQVSLAPTEMPAYGYGISSYNSLFKVKGGTVGFKNMGYGIYAGSGLSAKTPYWVEGVKFENCGVGITNRGVTGATMIFNEFILGYLPASSSYNRQYGISLANSINGMSLEENSFRLGELSSNENTIGIHSYSLGNFNNTIRRNSFDQINTANMAGGVNGIPANNFGSRGLYFECNANVNNFSRDFLICDFSSGPDRIRSKQGLPTINPAIPYLAAGNTFAYTGAPNDRDFSNAGDLVDYFYDPSSTKETPLSYSGIEIFTTDENTCPESDFDFIPGDPQEEATLKQIYYNSKAAYQTAKVAYESFENTGNMTLAAQKSAEGDYYQKQMDESTFGIVQSILFDTINYDADSLRFWLGNMNTYGAEMSLFADYLSTGEVQDARTILDNVSSKLDLSVGQLTDLDEVYTLLDLLGNRSPYLLVEEEESMLENIAAGTGEYAPGLAANILQIKGLLKGPRFGICDGDGGIEFWNPELANTSLTPDSGMEVFPNPAKDQVVFRFPQEAISFFNTKLILTDIRGAVIKELEFADKITTVAWDVQAAPNGIYFYQVIKGKATLLQGKIVVQH